MSLRWQGRQLRVAARREVLLCAGAIGSPALLQRSGIGPRPLLERLGQAFRHLRAGPPKMDLDLGPLIRKTQMERVHGFLAQAHWPGPLTLVLPRLSDAALAPAVSAGLPTIALRAPAHPVMQRWWAHMADIMATKPDNEPIATPLVPLFHLP